MKLFTTLLFYILAPGYFLIAQVNNVHQNQQWFQYYNQIQLSNKFFLVSDVGIRTKDNLKQVSQLLGRTSLSYSLNDQSSIALGFACFTSFKNDKMDKIEYRPFQEFMLKQKFHALKIQHRFRFEQRAFHSINNGTDNFNFRIRYRLYLTYPILSFGGEEKMVYGILADELFMNFGKEIIYNTFDQNRAIVGIGYSINKKFQINLTYVHQYAQKNFPNTFETTDLIWFGISHKIEKRNKE